MFMFMSDGRAGITANDVVVQLANVTLVAGINLTGGTRSGLPMLASHASFRLC